MRASSLRLVSLGRYKGGKVRLARHILPYLPDCCDRYLEPFGGLFSVGLNYYGAQERHYAELNPRTLNLLHWVQRAPSDLMVAIRDSDRSRETLSECWLIGPQGSLEEARRYYWVCYAMFAGGGTRWASGVTDDRLVRCQTHQAQHLGQVASRLGGVLLHSGDGIELLLKGEFNQASVLAYVDPPYTMDARGAKDNRSGSDISRSQYACECDHSALLDALLRYQGMAVVSGYNNPAYADALSDWAAIDIETVDSARKKVVDRLWINPLAWEGLSRQGDLFQELA